MALTTNAKNKIIADWKAGRFTTAYAVSKHYKIDQKTAQKIIDGISQDNADIVEIGTAYEIAKKSIKNPVEKKAIERLVEEKSIADDIQDMALNGTKENLKSLIEKIQSGAMPFIGDHRQAQETFDKALITAGKAPRHANQQINVSAQTNVQNNNVSLTKEQIEEELKKRGLPLNDL